MIYIDVSDDDLQEQQVMNRMEQMANYASVYNTSFSMVITLCFIVKNRENIKNGMITNQRNLPKVKTKTMGGQAWRLGWMQPELSMAEVQSAVWGGL